MTLDELLARESIRALLARYTMAGDRLRRDAFVAVFTHDAILESDGVPVQDAFRYEGRAAIGGWLDRWRADATAAAPRASFVRHHLTTSLIELEGADAARGRTYWTAYTDIGADHGGCYVDRFRRVDGEWLLAHRKVRLDWRAADSLFRTAVERTRAQP